MAFVLADRVQETATANTTVSFTLLGAVTGYQSFAALANNDTTYYGASDGTNWEVGLGTYSTTGPTLTRTTIYSSSNANAAVTFSGTVTVFIDYPAGRSVFRDSAGNVSSYTITGGSINNTPIGGSTANSGAFTTLSASSTVSGTGFSTYLASPPAIGGTAANAVSATTLSASSTVSGTGFTTYLASPPAIGGTAANAVTATNISSATAPTNTVPALALTGTPNGATGGKTGVLGIGTNFTASDKNIMASFVQSINDYTQIIVQNPNTGNAASADFVVNNDNTTGAGVYGDFGINSSTYAGSTSFNLANATYLYSQGGELVIGTQGSNGIRFVTNNSATDAASISSAGVLTLNSALALGSGGTGKTTAPASYANLLGFTTTATAGGTTTLTNTSSVYQVFTGTSAQTIQLPATSTLAQGWSFHLVNNSTNILTVTTSTSVTLCTISPGATVMPTALTTSGNTAADWEIGYTDTLIDARQVPQNAQTGNYTLGFSDLGEHIYHAANTAAATYTIPANSATPFEIGAAITFVNMSANNVSIQITTDTLYLAGTGTTGTRTLAQYGMATALKMTATTWIISGSGLT